MADTSSQGETVSLSDFTYGILTEIWFNPEKTEGYLGHHSGFSVLRLVYGGRFKDMILKSDRRTLEQQLNLKELMLQTADDFPDKILFRLSAKRLRVLADQL